MIECKNVTYQYPAYRRSAEVVLRNVHLTVQRGEWVALVGANGSGKSTFVRLLNGLLKAQKGTIRVCGLNPADEKEVWQVRRKVQMVFQNPENQIVGTTVQEDLIFGLENLGLPREEIAARMRWALARTGLSGKELQPVEQLSGGQKQRLAIASALAMKPDILILDEATTMLDLPTRQELLQLLQTLQKEEGLTILMVTHYMEETVFCDRIFIFHRGQIVREGTPAALLSIQGEENHALEDYGLEQPPLMRLADDLRREGVPLPLLIRTEEELVNALCTSTWKM